MTIASIEELAKEGLTYPDSFATSDERAYKTHACVFAVHRDSDLLQQSNWVVFCQELGLTPEPGLLTDVDGLDGSYIMRSGHWAVGWVETIMCPVYKPLLEGDTEEYTDAFLKAYELHEAIAHYPVLDEEDFSERETADLIACLNYGYDIPLDRVDEAYDWLREEGFESNSSDHIYDGDVDLIRAWYEQSDLDCPTWLTRSDA